jgi:tRNA (pseudouridine54-N1)-methyltransferase
MRSADAASPRLRRFVVVGRTATSSPDFSLVDLAGTSGRLDVLVRCIRAALLVSHGARTDVIVYLVLLGGTASSGEGPARVVRIDGRVSEWIRPEERRLALIVQRALEERERERSPVRDHEDGPYLVLRNGVAVANGGLEVALASIPASSQRIVLDEHGADVRDATIEGEDVTIVLGDHLGLDETARATIGDALAVSLGPTSVLAEDAIALMHNELDRRAHGRRDH